MAMTDEERLKSRRAATRRYMERKRRERGVMPRKPARSLEETRAARRQEAARMRELKPDYVQDMRRRSMTKRRLADELRISIEEVPNDLFIAKCLVLDVTRKVKELSK